MKEIDSPAWNLFSSENESPATVNGISKAPRFPTRLESQSELDDHDPASSYSQKLLVKSQHGKSNKINARDAIRMASIEHDKFM